MGPLAVCPQNPRYFQNTATGEVVYLTGSHTWANLVDVGPSDPPPPFDYDKYVGWMAKLNHNFMRMWTWELVTWDTTANGENKHHRAAPQPYARTGHGEALDGKPQFDLMRFDPAYFERLRKRVAIAREHGIYVSVMLFEGWGLQFSPGAWEGHPFNPKNNVNGINGDTDGEVLGQNADAKWDPIRHSMGCTLQYARRMDLAQTRPAPDLASTAYCLADPGKQYIVYRPQGQADPVTVKLKAGTYRYEWFDPASGRQASVGTKAVTEAEARFPCPLQGDAALSLTRTVSPAEN
jgi:hypothetical protein